MTGAAISSSCDHVASRLIFGPGPKCSHGPQIFSHCSFRVEYKCSFPYSLISPPLELVARMSKMEPPPIPPIIRIQILPHPRLSIADFLRFPLPNQLPDSNFQNFASFWSSEAPNVVWDDFQSDALPDLPIPSTSMISSLLDLYPQHASSSSILYTHIGDLHGQSDARYPLWILTYWMEVSRLQQHVKRLWLKAKSFLAKAQNDWAHPETRQLANSAQLALIQLPWAGEAHGFPDPEPVVLFAHYLSEGWLRTTHINQQLDLLQCDLVLGGHLHIEVVNPRFFTKLLELYNTRSHVPYVNKSGSRNIWAIGEALAQGVRLKVGGVANINANHWVGIVIDQAQSTILYGDSLSTTQLPSNSNILDALGWWVNQHTKSHFTFKPLAITVQMDDYNCGILSVNAVQNALLPGKENGLLPSSIAAINRQRIAIFKRTVNHDLGCVSVGFHQISSILY